MLTLSALAAGTADAHLGVEVVITLDEFGYASFGRTETVRDEALARLHEVYDEHVEAHDEDMGVRYQYAKSLMMEYAIILGDWRLAHEPYSGYWDEVLCEKLSMIHETVDGAIEMTASGTFPHRIAEAGHLSPGLGEGEADESHEDWTLIQRMTLLIFKSLLMEGTDAEKLVIERYTAIDLRAGARIRIPMELLGRGWRVCFGEGSELRGELLPNVVQVADGDTPRLIYRVTVVLHDEPYGLLRRSTQREFLGGPLQRVIRALRLDSDKGGASWVGIFRKWCMEGGHKL